MKIETNIYTIRHARTQYNAEKRYAGTIDVPLSKTGLQEAQETSEKLNGLSFDVVITSAMKRSFDTACILVGNSVPIVRKALCNERNFGIMEGLTWKDVQALNPPILFIQVGNDLHSVNPKGGEPFEDLWIRAKKFHRHLFSEYKGKNILVVSHAVFLQSFHGLLRGLSCLEALAIPYPANNELSIFKFSGRELVEGKCVRLVGTDLVSW